MASDPWKTWQERWDRQQEIYLVDRERRFQVMVDIVEAAVGPAPRVLDLACGTGSISIRLLQRLPDARTVCVDADPALLRIAAGTFAGDDRVAIVQADLSDPAWTTALPNGPFDAVLTATALHWLREDALARLYRDLANQVLRPFGIFSNADHMADRPMPTIDGLVQKLLDARRDRLTREGAADWEGWWQDAAADSALSDAVAARNASFIAAHEEFAPPVDWHLDALHAAGFRETTVMWRMYADAIIAALR
jgi:SAM-dependent methyltransferase